MPVIVHADEAGDWLHGQTDDPATIETLGTAWDGRFKFHPVAPFGIRRDDGPALSKAR